MLKKMTVVIILMLLPTLLLIGLFKSFISDIKNQRAVYVIMGEAADQGLKGMIAVGEVIRNRGEIEGFSVQDNNLKDFFRKQPKNIQQDARLAWFLSGFTNLTYGADHFENVKRFGRPEWAADMSKTATIADMSYYVSK